MLALPRPGGAHGLGMCWGERLPLQHEGLRPDPEVGTLPGGGCPGVPQAAVQQ